MLLGGFRCFGYCVLGSRCGLVGLRLIWSLAGWVVLGLSVSCPFEICGLGTLGG